MVNGKAFVIAPEPIEKMESELLNNGAYLSWYSGIPVVFSKDKRFILIGDCWSLKRGEEPEKFIAEAHDLSAEKILERENYWCGRYILILDGSVYMDATGTLSVFYNDKYISNSLNMLRELLGLSLKKEKLYFGLSPDFVPGTKTQYGDIKRLLPSLVYNINTKSVTARSLMPVLPEDFKSEEERTRAFTEELAEGLKNMDSHFSGKTKLIACTGGRDSRALAAVAEYAGLQFDTFTLEHDDISQADVDIPVQISGALGKKHYYIKKDKSRFSSKKLKDFDIHTCNYVNGADRVFYGYGQFEELKKQVGGDIVLLRSAVWEITSDYYKKDISDFSIYNIKTIFPLINNNSVYLDSVEDWLSYVKKDDKNSNINVPDRLYWDLREGCWLACIEQAFDIYDEIVSVQPINCRRLISLLMGYDAQERTKKTHEEIIANFACPRFADIPYDYQIKTDSADGKLKQYGVYFKKAWWLLWNYGPGAVMFFVKNKSN